MIEKLKLAMQSAARQGILVEGRPEWSWPGVLTDDAHLRKLTEGDIIKAVRRANARGLPQLLIALYADSLGTASKNVAADLERLDELMDLCLGRKE